MLFAVMGYFKPGVDTAPANLQDDFNEHLGQPNFGIRLAGALRDRDGKRIGFMGLLEADSFDRAEAYLRQSPYAKADLYGRMEVMEFPVEVGRLN